MTSRWFVLQKLDEGDKNHKENMLPDDAIDEGQMYELHDNQRCPINCFAKYLSKLHPENEALWQRPLNGFIEDEPWYLHQPLSHNMLNTLMKTISKSAHLSQQYINY